MGKRRATERRVPAAAPTAKDDILRSVFQPCPLPAAFADCHGAEGMREFQRLGVLAEFQVGRKHGRIASFWRTTDGAVDTLTSMDPLDTDYGALLRAHVARLCETVKYE